MPNVTATTPSDEQCAPTAPDPDAEMRDRVQQDVARIMTAIRPHTVTFTSSITGLPVTFTGLPGCTASHKLDSETPTDPAEVFCWTQNDPDAVTLPIDNTGRPEEYRVLNTYIEVDPYSPRLARRLPYAVVEVVDEHYIADLTPDALASVIGVLAGRLHEMRRVHAELVRVRADYTAREARIEASADRIVDALREVKPGVTA